MNDNKSKPIEKVENEKDEHLTPLGKSAMSTNAGNSDFIANADSEVSFADKLYNEITSVIGGDNPNQFFCMGLPGTLLEANQYSYDIENNQPKPSFVEANESKLVNKLFDACHMTASDNGRRLSTQYKTALDVLTPKLNGKLFDAKTKLRKVLMTPYPYNFEDGGDKQEILTLEQVFFRLYHEYVIAKQEWAKKQVDKKNELAKKYPGDTREDYRKRDNEFLDWYEIVAEGEVLVVEEKLGKVLSVFSPGDMSIITGILDSGAGREIAEARMVLSNTGKLNPDGGYVYPVTLYPENWFTLLDTSFSGVDLLESPAALAQQLSVLIAQRSKITTNINTFLEGTLPEAEVKKLKENYNSCKSAYSDALKALGETYVNVTTDMLKTFVDVYASRLKFMSGTPTEILQSIPENVTCRIFGIAPDAITGLINKFAGSATKCLEAQNKLIDSAQETTDAALTYFTEKNKLEWRKLLTPLKQQLEDTNNQINALQQKIDLAAGVQKAAEENQITDNSDVAPNHVPENFTQIIISSTMSEVSNESSSKASSSSSSAGVSFFFGGYSRKSSHSKAVSESLSEQKNMSIQIGMSVAKVKIGREWFNPGVFLLSADMYNTSSEHIAPARNDYEGFTPERFTEMNKCLLPCFPTAFVIARDVTIKFSTSASMSSAFAQSVEDHASSGGGFFIFSGSSSSSSSSSQSSAKATASSKSVIVRFTNPQIIGYYLEATPADKSVSISSKQPSSNADFISIFEFIEAFQAMLNDHNKTYNKDTLRLNI